MKITTRISTSGESGYISMPKLAHPAEFYGKLDGTLDEQLFRSELGNHPCLQFSSDDTRAVLAFTIELLDRMKISFDRCMAQDKSIYLKNHSDKVTPAERRFYKGKIAYVSVSIRSNSSGFVIKVAAQNPLGVVGRTESFTKTFAQLYADNIVAIQMDMNKIGNTKFKLVDGEGCSGIFEEALRRNNEQIMRNKYWDCEHRHNGFCSPCNPSCPLFNMGKCNWK